MRSSYISVLRFSRIALAAAFMATGLMSAPTVHAAGAKANAMPSQADQKLVASVAAGGRMYDNWIRELALKKPKSVHPLYPSDGKYTDTAWQTWRCVTCHGWDYLGDRGGSTKGENFTGIKGVSGMIGSTAEQVAEVLRDDKHGYGDFFDDRAMVDISNFVVKGLVPMDRVVDRATGRALIEPVSSSAHFSTICVNCHGADGRMMKTIPPLGEAARRNPWQAMHKMLNGHPGDDMPALRAFDVRTTLSTLAFIQALPPRDPLYSIARGGKLYDDWAEEIGTRYPKDAHLAFPKDKQVDTGSSTWRCVECHGWDYKGAHGIRGVRNMIGAHPSAIIKVLKDDTHNLDHKLQYADFYDLASFVSQGQVDMNEYIDARSMQARGEADNSTQYYLTLCATCHGDEGKDIRTMPSLGRVATERPWQALHKVLHGHPGDQMPAWQATMTPSVIKDVLAKLQTLPTRK
ncbi:MAG: c-type cytochrome [Magnetovibrio sp.]|nr:c-type cytochrome [Magnetovibrio sp.]